MINLTGKQDADPLGRAREMVESGVYDIGQIEDARTLIEELEIRVAELEMRTVARTAELSEANRLLERANRLLEAEKAQRQVIEAELRRNKMELQEFAFVASHDLQEPLRKVGAFGKLLYRELENSLEGDAKDYLNRMIGAAGRMEELLRDLLQFSRINTRANPFKNTDLNEVLIDTLNDLKVLIKKSGCRIEVEAAGESSLLPAIEADEPQMRLLFQNLISNAIKYQPKDREPFIKICGETDGRACRIHVQDNGIGFDESCAEQIFRPFQRLHGRSGEYSGTGMGLAVCKRIVERHKGTITARSVPGLGSVFTVELPLKQAYFANTENTEGSGLE
ncbi:Signal transduction histidine kinase (fragment) [Syntrophobacter sp. SbD1]